jgi:hypothetical protein
MDAMSPWSADVIRRIQHEFLEMSGLRLTEKQACRLWGLEAPLCAAILNALVEAGFLLKTQEGTFIMRIDPATPLKIDLSRFAKGRSVVA